jgi:hypothetical protein
MTYTEIVKKLVGPVYPVGDASRDPERFENLKEMCELVNQLVTIIDKVGYDNRNSYEHSVKEMSDYANDFLKNTLGITE